MEDLSRLKAALETERPVPWNEFPDISLYKDQVLTYMERQLIHFSEEDRITSAMINNYIKAKLIPRAEGKKYTREHLAGLTEIGLLKQVLTVEDTGYLLQQELETAGPEDFYRKFRQVLDQSLAETAAKIDPEWSNRFLSDMALKLAVTSYCHKVACERLLELIRTGTEPDQKKPQKKINHRD
jgi:hypothetical protein